MSIAIRPLAEDDIPAVVEFSLRAWTPVFASFEQVLGHRVFTHLYPDWRRIQAQAVEEADGGLVDADVGLGADEHRGAAVDVPPVLRVAAAYGLGAGLFFLSYARGSDDRFVREFFLDLSNEIREVAGIAPGTDVGYRDELVELISPFTGAR